MNSGATVRIASPEDLDCLITLILGFRDHGGQPLPTDDQLRDILPRLLAEQNTQFFLAADPDGDCLGYAQQRYRYSIWTQALQADIEDMFVVPSGRRRGVAGALLQFAIECARTRGCQQISVDTNERNEEALGLYEKYGFSAVSPRWNGRRVLLRPAPSQHAARTS